MQIAIEGCCHGDLDKIYTTLQHLEAKQRIKVDLLICCGDFQASSFPVAAVFWLVGRVKIWQQPQLWHRL